MYNTEAVVLKKDDAGEYGALFTLYARDFGKIRALAQGIKKEGAKLKGHLEPLNLSRVGLVSGKSGERLIQAEVITVWLGIRENFDKLKTAFAAAACIDQECLPGEKDEEVWRVIIEDFVRLEQQPFSLQEFRTHLRAALGYPGDTTSAVVEKDKENRHY